MKKLLLIALLLLFVGGCQSSKTTMRQSGFLTDYSRLAPHESIEADAGLIWVAEDFAPAQYSGFMVDPVQLWLPEDYDQDVTIEELQALTVYFHDVLIKALEDRYRVVQEPAPGVLRIRSAITNVEPSSPGADIASSLVPVGILISLGKQAATGRATGVGEASIEVEFLDAISGRSLAAYQGVRYGEKYDGGGTDEMNDAQHALQVWAAKLREYFDTFHDLEQQ